MAQGESSGEETERHPQAVLHGFLGAPADSESLSHPDFSGQGASAYRVLLVECLGSKAVTT